MKRTITVLTILFLTIQSVICQTEKDEWADEILKLLDRNLMPESYEAYRKVVDIEPDGNQKEYILYTVKKGLDKVAILFLSPASEKDRAILRLGENMWLYIPGVGKPIRQTSLQSATGGIFNNSDLMMLDFSAEYNAFLEEETDEQYILLLKAKNRTAAYDSLKIWVYKDSLLLTQIKCYSASGMLMKILEFKEVKDFGNGLVRPSVIETYSPLYEGYRSIMIFGQITERDFPDEVFTLAFFPKLGDLR
jgi:outer membrane lipoprotein-sorting protein